MPVLRSGHINTGNAWGAGLPGIQGGVSDQMVQDPDYRWGLEKQMGMQARGMDMAQGRFDRVFGLLSGQLGNGGMARVGGRVAPAPRITVGGVYNPQQIQSQVNQSNANIAQQAATNIRDMQSRMAGTGMGSNSPLAQALMGQTQAAALGDRLGQATDIRNQAAQMNAKQLLNSEQARSNQWAQGEQLAIERMKPYWQQRSALLSALAGLA